MSPLTAAEYSTKRGRQQAKRGVSRESWTVNRKDTLCPFTFYGSRFTAPFAFMWGASYDEVKV